MKRPKYTAVIFDFDGTLVDSMPDILACIKVAYKKEGLLKVNPKKEHIGPPLMECLKLLTPDLSRAALESVGQHFREAYDTSSYPKTTLYQGVKETLLFLKNAGAKLYLVTNKRSYPTFRMLKKFNLPYFLLVISPDLKKGKTLNKTKMLAYLLKKEKIKAKNAVYVGDSKADILCAHANKMAAAAVTYGYNTVKQLKEGSPEYLIKNIKELRKIAGGRPQG